jgi:hypothetical protein
VCDEPALEVVVRVDAYRDQPVKLWPGQKFEIILRGLGEPGNPEGAFRGVFRVGGRPFEIIRNMLVLDPEAWEDDQAGASP